MHRAQRIVARCRVAFPRGDGDRDEGETEDLSLLGAFVRTERPLAVGAAVRLALLLPDGPPAEVDARVVHALEPAIADALSRRPGMGVEFVALEADAAARLTAFLGQRLAERGGEPAAMPGQAFAVVADPSAARRERLEHALAAIGFEPLGFASGADALAACQEFTPDVVVAALAMPDLDGVALLSRFKARPALCDVAVVLLADPADDFARLEAYRLGVRDVLTQPFTDEELGIRVRRAALEARRPPVEPVLRGSLAEITLPTLLSLFEFERKSGALLVFADQAAARLTIAAGKVVRVEGPRGHGGGDPRAGAVRRLMEVLDWTHGRFEFTAGQVVAEGDDLGLGTSEILLEHARLRDEAGGGGDA